MSLRAATVLVVERVRQRWLDIALVAAITAAVALVSQRWTGFNSPDSEFYASLALFGSDVTDRAIEPAYIWTRLGYIVPVRVLVSVFGPWVGFEIWRVLLLLIVIGATYSVVHIAGRSRTLGAVLSGFVGLNTVILAFVGNTYLTGTILAATFAMVSLAVSLLGHAAGKGDGALGGPRWTTALTSGLLAGWLIMINPYAFLLAVGLWASVRLVVLVRLPTERWQRLGVDLLAAAIGTVIAFVAFLVAGLAVFPGRNWIATYLEWNSRLDYTVFIGDGTTWQRDSALVVLVAALLASAVATIAQPRHRWAWAALALSMANIALTVGLMIALPGPWLESPTYVAKLWPAALLSLVLVFTSMAPGSHEGKRLFPWSLGLMAAAAVPLLLWSGRYDGVLPYSVAWAIGLVMVAGIVAVAILVRRHWSVWISMALAVSIALTFIGMQFLQNGRGILGTYGQYPFRSAFVDFSYDQQMASKIAVEQWLLANTSRTDSIAIWTDVDRLTADVAAMQMWGGDNLVTLDATLSREGVETLESIRPSVVSMYAPDRTQIDAFFASLPPWSLPSEPECTYEPYLGIGTGEVVACLTRLTWVG
ncbi:hypothetical protein OAV85_00770 [Candidatus Nanopelagicales bacterium]|nr:hypothetical protein [Candidatus Nanopelagicales bacterium]